MRILVKIGGAQLEQSGPRAELATALARARAAGHELIVVHGGGNQIRTLVRRLGLPERYHEGLRVTDAETAEVVLQVLCGQVNKELVDTLVRAGLPAVGLCGADGASFGAAPLRAESIDLGFVGSVARVQPGLARTLLAAGFVPVFATSAPLAAGASGSAERFYNINADTAAGPLAAALACDAIVFLTDVPAVLDGSKRRLAQLDAARCAELVGQGVIAGGMIPKVEAALAGLAAAPGALVKIAPAAGANALLDALRPEIGTHFLQELVSHG